jgi:molecular chaperone GrpE
MSEPVNEETKPEDLEETDSNEPIAEESQSDGEHLDATDAAFDAVSEPETRDEEMERLRDTAEQADKRVLMAQAEAENFRKRMRRDFEDQLKFAALPMIAEILGVRDNLIRAIEAADGSADSAGLKEGVQMVTKQLDDTLAKYGVREIPTEGELFDPNFHEAISQMPGEAAAGMVAHVAVTGFQMHDRVVRPSQVVVSTGPAEG